MIKEQRKTVRHESQSNVYYTFPGSSERYSGRCINLSNNGILLECDQQVKLNAAMMVCLLSDNEGDLPLNMLVEVNWQNKHHTGQYRAGATIKAILGTHEVNNV
jgi:hypothetical protein